MNSNDVVFYGSDFWGGTFRRLNPQPSWEDIMGSYELWGQYIDPLGLDRNRWPEMTEEQKRFIIEACWPGAFGKE